MKMCESRTGAFTKGRIRWFHLIIGAIFLSGCGGAGDSGGDSQAENPSANIPDQDSFSIASEFLTIDQAADKINITSEITVKFADNLNNPLDADGTTVFFTTEGGDIPSSCEIVDGQCVVTWSSGDEESKPADHRVDILAWTMGTESYVDLNSNGFFDDGDIQTDDLPEPFRDDNENGIRDTDELFIEFPSGVAVSSGSDASYDGADGLYSGQDCAHSTDCAPNQLLFIFEQQTIVLGTTDPGGSIAFTDCAGTTLTAPLTPGRYCALVTDANGSPMPDGSSVSYTADEIEVEGMDSTPATISTLGSLIEFELTADTTPSIGTLKVLVTSDAGARVTGRIDTDDT